MSVQKIIIKYPKQISENLSYCNLSRLDYCYPKNHKTVMQIKKNETLMIKLTDHITFRNT